MDLFQGLWRRIFGSQDERRDDHNVRNRNPVYENHPVNITPPNFPSSRVILVTRVTRSAPFDQPNVGDSSTTNPQHIQELLERSNEVHLSSTSSSPLPPTFSYRQFQSSYKPPQSSSNPSPSSSNSATSSSKSPPSFRKPHQSASKPSPSSSSSFLKDPTYPSKSSASASSSDLPDLPPSSFSPSSKSSVSSPNNPKPPPDSSPTYSKPPQSSPSLAPSSSKPLRSSPKPAAPSSSQKPASSHKPSLSSLKGTSPIYAIPEDIKGLIERGIVPTVLKQPLSSFNYKRYFAALLYAEDYYLEKWSNFQLKNVILELDEAENKKRSNKYKKYDGSVKKDDKIFVAFEFDSAPEKRPFLLSRDLVYARPSGKKVKRFQGFIHRVAKSTRVLVKFGDDFHSQHSSTCKYDISFSFNKDCLKRARQAIEAASDPLFQNFLFPECTDRKNTPPAQFPDYQELGIDEFAAVHHILSFHGSPPYLLGGSLSVTKADKSATKEAKLSRTGVVVREAVFEAYKTSPDNRILVCAPINSTCDVLNRSLKEKIPESDMFRANAAFREIDGVPIDILSSCPIEGECFAYPSVQQLLKVRIILSTFVSSFRLHNEGIAAGHFSHIFLVDASSATEPEAMVALANFANDNTSVIVTGAPGDHSGWVHSDVGRKYGLRKSYFERLLELGPYRIPNNPMFIAKLDAFDR